MFNREKTESKRVPMMPVRDLVIFPQMMNPFIVGRESSLRALEEDLLDDSLVYRYRAPDGFTGKEGTFCMCSFWYIECLSRSCDIRQARLLFERMPGYANHLGLFAEELGPSGEHLGNFPQAFTHVALISAAFDLNRRLSAANENDAPEA